MFHDLQRTVLLELSTMHVDCLKQYNPHFKTVDVPREDVPKVSQLLGGTDAGAWQKPRVFALYASSREHDLTWLQPLSVSKIATQEGIVWVDPLMVIDGVSHEAVKTQIAHLWSQNIAHIPTAHISVNRSALLGRLGITSPEKSFDKTRITAILEKLGITVEQTGMLRSV